MTLFRIRRATEADFQQLTEIEDDAAEIFRDIGYDFCVDTPSMETSELSYSLNTGTILLAETETEKVAGFAILWQVDDQAHMRELNVLRSFQRMGLGKLLISASKKWAVENGYTALTLTTFSDVAWNMPYYRKLGFEVITPTSYSAELAAIRQLEIQKGHDIKPRCAMRKKLNDGYAISLQI